MIGWGFYWRKVRLGELVDSVGPIPVKRWRCTACRRTFSYLPPFVLVLKRYAASAIQGIWECRVDHASLSLEQLAERWGLPCVVTLRRWLAPFDAWGAAIESELRRVLPFDVGGIELDRQPARRILSLVQLYTTRASLHPLDRERVPYHHVSHIVRRLQTCSG